MDHSELAALGLASGHADITHWLRRYGKHMDDFRLAVITAMAEGIDVEYVDVARIEGAWTKVNETYEVYAANGGYTNLREQPDTSSASLEQMRNGDRVRVIEQNGAWSRVETERHTGYVMIQFLREIAEDGLPVIEDTIDRAARIVIRDSIGNTFRPVGECTIDLEYSGESVD